MAELIPPMILSIEARVGQAEKDLKKVTDAVDKFGKQAKTTSSHSEGLTGSLKKMATAAAGLFALHEVTRFLSESGKAAVEDQKSQALLERQIKATTGATSEQIKGTEETIRAMSNQAAVMDDKIRPAMATLVRATGDLGQATNLTRLALDVSAGTGRSLESVAIALAKAHNGNTGALQRLGISLKGVSDPMAYLEKQFAGAAKTAANVDPYQRLQVAMDHIRESVGTALLPMLNKLATWLTDISPKIEQFFKDLNDPATEVGSTWKALTDTFAKAFDWITKNIKVVGILVGAFIALKVVLGAVKLATELATAAQWLLNIAESASPVGAFLLILGGLATLYLTLAGNTDKATAAQKRYGAEIGRGGSRFASMAGANTKTPGSGMSSTLNNFAALSPAQKAAAKAAADAAASATDYGSGSGSGSGSGTKTTTVDPFVTYLKDTQKKILAARDNYTKAVQDANTKYGDLIEQYQNEMTDIIQRSMDRLRSVFATAVATDVGALFASINQEGTATADQLLFQLETRLNAGKKLAENAAALSGLGYSQTFIEQLIASGTETGNAMAEALKTASPETAKAIQETFVATEKLAGSGMDDLAKKIYEKSGLATDELKALFNTANNNMIQAQKDLQTALVSAASILNESLITIEDAFTAKLATMAGAAKKYGKEIADVYAAISGAMATTPTAPFQYVPDYMTNPTFAPEKFTPITAQSVGGPDIFITNNIDTSGTPVDINTVTANSIKFGLPYTMTTGTGIAV